MMYQLCVCVCVCVCMLCSCLMIFPQLKLRADLHLDRFKQQAWYFIPLLSGEYGTSIFGDSLRL